MAEDSISPPSDERKKRQQKSKKKLASPESSFIPGSVNELQKKGELGGVRSSAVQTPLKKQLKSGPLYQKRAIALAEKVKGRKPLKSKSRESLSSDEIVFPLSYGEKAKRKKKTIIEEQIFPGPLKILTYDTCAGISDMKGMKVPRHRYSKMPVVTNNNCNNNKLFIDGMPFWWNPVPWDITDDEVVMNAAVIIDVLENRIKLVPMPDIEIILDPAEAVSKLQERDGQCFTKEIIFGNTVRSMVNMNELSLRELYERSVRKFRKKKFPSDPSKKEPEPLNIVEPKVYNLYTRENRTDTSTAAFTPTKRGRYSRENDVFGP
ncbi:hypothetical protein Aduo_006447 [Ancylostoma duodenale]